MMVPNLGSVVAQARRGRDLYAKCINFAESNRAARFISRGLAFTTGYYGLGYCHFGKNVAEREKKTLATLEYFEEVEKLLEASDPKS